MPVPLISKDKGTSGTQIDVRTGDLSAAPQRIKSAARAPTPSLRLARVL
jgi:hypothetical protein